MIPTIMDVAALAVNAFSPSKTCRVRVSSTRYRNDPYRARVLPIQHVAAPSLVKMAPSPRFAPAPASFVSASLVKPVPTFAALAARPAPVVVPITAAVSSAPVVAPKAPASSAPQPRFALVGFKHEASMFQAPFRVAVGDVVIVEADRGEHIGVVQSITTQAPSYNVPSRILRHANAFEVDAIDELTLKESKTTQAVQKLAESLGLGIRVVDTEFQLDQNKLTVFFTSKVFVDFRKLQRGLFREFRCRIWLVNWAEVRTYTPVTVNPVA